MQGVAFTLDWRSPFLEHRRQADAGWAWL